MVRQVKPIRIDLGDITDKNVGQLKVLYKTLFPVSYQAPFYKSVIEDTNYMTKLAFYGGDALVGAVSCRLEQKEGKNQLYIMTLGVLAVYRDLGIGRQLLEYILAEAPAHFKDITLHEIYLHVQEGNDAIKFYEKFGFVANGTTENYYTNIEPSNAVILCKIL